MDQTVAIPLQIGNWRFDPNRGEISREQEVVRLEGRTVRLLLYLAERPGAVVSIDELLNQVWSGVIVTPDSVYQAIATLRRQLGDDTKQPTYVVTVPRLGYRMVASVTPWDGGVVPGPKQSPSAIAAAAPHMPVTGPTVGSKKAGFGLGVAAALILAVTAAYLGYNRIATRQAAGDARGSQPQRSVAVLPFLDLTTQEMNEEYFADGITEELIGDLSRVPGLRVPAPSSSFYFKGKDMPLAVVARQLGVYFVVDGSVRKAGTSYRVATRLSRADNGYVIWTNAYERQLGDLLTIQKSIAAEAAVAIRESIERALPATTIFTTPRTGFLEALPSVAMQRPRGGPGADRCH
jgi:TolB-like protein/DNA-binding winged helix-turn-helix (wHTH) protein